MARSKRGKARVQVNLQKLIEARSPEFSKGQRGIAKFILAHHEKAAYMTAAKLSGAVGVSEATVVRFAAMLGFSGYPALQRAVADMSRVRLTAVQRLAIAQERIAAGKSVLRYVMQEDITRIRGTLEEISEESFQAAVAAIDRANNIYILGVRSAGMLASFLGFYLGLILPGVRVVGDGAAGLEEQILRVGPGDLVIGISFPRYSKRTIRGLRYAAKRGAEIIAVTDGDASPICEGATYSLFAQSDMASFVDSLVAPLSLLGALIVAVAERRRAEVSLTLEELETLWDETGLYEKIEGARD